MPKVSVIIPVYNSEVYLREAVQTVLDQTEKDIEVILVNDHSTDTSWEICDDISEQDPRVVAVNLPVNKGICGARNEGLKRASGEYIAFCDNDDFFTPELIEENYETAKKQDADMVKFGRKLIDVDSNGKVLRQKESPIPQSFYFEGKDELLSNFFAIKSFGLLTNVWNGLYKLSVIKENDIWFDETMRFGSEDADFSLRFFDVSNNLAINPKSYYIHYRRNASSTSRKFSLNKIESMTKAAESESHIWDQLEETDENKVQKVIAKNNHVINIAMYQIFHQNSPLKYREKREMLKQLRGKEHLNYPYDKTVSKQIRKTKPKQWLFTLLYSKKYYTGLYSLLSLENKVSGEKW